MALGDSLEKLIAHRQKAGAGANSDNDARESEFAPVIQSLRRLVSGVDARFIKSKLTKLRAVIRVGNGSIDLGWDVTPGVAKAGAPEQAQQRIKLTEVRNFMSDERASATLWFADEQSLTAYLESEIEKQISTYRH
jgi:hypothetical protein